MKIKSNLLISGLPLLMLAVSAGCFRAAAQEVKTLTLEEAIETGLRNSRQVKIALSETRQAEAALKEVRQQRLPDLNISGQYMRLLNTANVHFQTGSDDTAAPEDNSGQQNEGQKGPASPDYLALGQASLSVPLFTGFRLNHAMRSAEYLKKATKLDAEADQSGVILNLAEAWANLFKAGSAVQLMEENLKQAHQRTRDFSNLEENGLLARNDLLKARLQESDVELALLEARNNLEITGYNMNLLLGLPESTVLRADTALPARHAAHLPGWSTVPESPNDVMSLGQMEEGALEKRKDLASATLKAAAASEEVKVAASERWPTVGLSAGYVAADLHDVLTVTNAVNAGLGISFNLASLYKAGSRIDQAKERAMQLKFAGEQKADQVRLQVHRAFGDYQLSLKKVEVYQEAVEQATENYRITRNKHVNSLATTTDLLDADVAQLKTRLNVRYAEVDALVAWYKLLKASGQLTL